MDFANFDLRVFSVHNCLLDTYCRSYGAPKRVHVKTRYGQLIIGERIQGWLPFIGYLPYDRRYSNLFWWPVTWHPSHSRDADK